MQWIAIDAIKPNPRNARTHSKKQIRQIADSITVFGFLVPILIDDGGSSLPAMAAMRQQFCSASKKSP
jgi:ParB-like chromosome segregation protein Spo0J